MQEQDELDKTIQSLNKQVGNSVSNVPPAGTVTTQAPNTPVSYTHLTLPTKRIV